MSIATDIASFRTPSPEQPMRAVIDTSRRRRNHWILRLARKRSIIPVGNRETDAELLEKMHEYYTPEHGANAYLQVRDAYAHYDQYRVVVTGYPSHPTPRCEDRNDQMFIDLAYAGDAEILLTRDTKLLVMNGQTPFPIVHDQRARQALDPD